MFPHVVALPKMVGWPGGYAAPVLKWPGCTLVVSLAPLAGFACLVQVVVFTKLPGLVSYCGWMADQYCYCSWKCHAVQWRSTSRSIEEGVRVGILFWNHKKKQQQNPNNHGPPEQRQQNQQLPQPRTKTTNATATTLGPQQPQLPQPTQRLGLLLLVSPSAAGSAGPVTDGGFISFW